MISKVQTDEAFQNLQIFTEIQNITESNQKNKIIFNASKNPQRSEKNKNKPKFKTMPPIMMSKLQKITKFQNLIHSDVSEVVKKTFIIELYRGVKYSIKSLKGPSDKIINQKKIKLKQIPKSRKKFLFLDLDQTLIYTEKRSNSKLKSSQISYKIHVRPYTYQFLENLSKHFDLYIFTAATRDYAEAVIEKLNSEKKIIQDYLCRDHCFETQRGKLIKDLRIIENRQLKDIILIDNKPQSFGLQIDNGIPILDFYGSRHDCQLKNLESILIKLSMMEDVRVGIQEHFKLRSILQITKEEIQAYLKCGKSFGTTEKYIPVVLNS